MSRYDADDDAFEWINGKKVLKDGGRAHVPLAMRDAATKRARLTDGNGNSDVCALSRPGFRLLADAGINDAREAARREYLEYITNAWRTKPPRV